jgi:hypothetical protein
VNLAGQSDFLILQVAPFRGQFHCQLYGHVLLKRSGLNFIGYTPHSISAA